MKRKQFFAELSQYLSFLSAQDKADILEIYAKMFDDAGEADEEALIASLGTPMKLTIDLKRRLEAGKQLMPEMDYVSRMKDEAAIAAIIPDNFRDPATESQKTHSKKKSKGDILSEEDVEKEALSDSAAETTDKTSEPVEETTKAVVETAEEVSEPIAKTSEKSSNPVTDIDEEVSEPVNETLVETSDSVAKNEAEAVSENAETDISDTENSVSVVDSAFGKNAHKFSSTKAFEATGNRSVPKTVGAALISIVVVLFFLTTSAIGGIMIFALEQCIVAVSMGTLSSLNDILLLLGGGLLAGGVGLFIIWLSVWAAIHIISAMFASAKGKDYEDAPILRKIWTVIAIISIALAVLGIVGCALSILSDGSVERLRQNYEANFVLRRFSMSNLILSFKTIFGF